ncbi:hypothetical protein ACQKP1_25600 [Allorhizobium sp. NPDC080224]|uniref:hypothetical protein n=1 Tax=Allorhizobium sp. NPDC080224 TaxID=3390547 RepID=UPI003CFF4A46
MSQDGVYGWEWYKDYTQPVDLPGYFRAPPVHNSPIRLSEVTREYDWSQNGYQNIGQWIDMAAQDAGH